MKRKQYPSREYLLECFRYEDGKLYWLKRPIHHFISEHEYNVWNTKHSGKLAGHVSKLKRRGISCYRYKITIAGRDYYRNILVWIMHGYPLNNNEQIDHINTNSLDDRIENLRVATNAQNQANRRKSNNNTSGYKGVYRTKSCNKWIAQIRYNDRLIYLGTFDNTDDARQAYMDAAKKYFGEFANSG